MKGWKMIGMVIAACFMYACSPHTEYTNALPKDASLMLSADLQAMALKGGLGNGNTQSIEEKIGGLIQESLPDDAARFAHQIVEDPSETGLSFSDKVYVFATPHANAIGLVAKVKNEGKLEKMFNLLEESHLCNTLTEESGCRWTQMGNTLCAFNNGTFLAMHNRTGGAENIKGTLLSLMRQQEGEGFASSSDYSRLATSDADICLLTDFSLIPDQWTTFLRMGLPADIRLEDIRHLVNIRFEKGLIQIEAEDATKNPAVQAFYQSMDKMTMPIQGKFMNAYPGKSMTWAGVNMDGKTIYNTLCQNPSIRQFMQNPPLPIDIERIFASIIGDVSIGMQSFLNGGWIAYAQVTNDQFLETFEELRPLLAMSGGQVALYDTATNQYALKSYLGIHWFGVKNDVLYITNRHTLAEEAGRTYGVSLDNRPWASEARKNRLIGVINAASLMDEMRENPYAARTLAGKETWKLIDALTGGCEDIVLNAQKWEKFTLDIQMKDKRANVLETLVKTLEKL